MTHKTIPNQTEDDLQRLRNSVFCAVEGCNAYKYDCPDRNEINSTRWICGDCADENTIDFLRGEGR